ncbi:alpha/beta fold hydrolase [Aestuariivirga sp.]|uniref:alpha/beta fold hydrolase n=1 Tax=Aestuariivirga sp. TaxID=2650926 RepID=UPI0039E2BC9E
MGRLIAMPLPRLGETMEEGRIGLLLKSPGEKFRRGETLLEVESDKTTVEVPALQDGVLVEWLVGSDQMVPVESAIAMIEIEGEAVAEAKQIKAAPQASAAPRAAHVSVQHATGMRPRASTAARALARRQGVDLATLTGTGRNGRITRADLASSAKPRRSTYHVETPQGRIFMRDWPAQGKERGTALLIHGLFSDSQSFGTLARKLAAKGLRTLAADLPGHGETVSSATSIDDIVQAIRAVLPPGAVHLIGHSFGAIIATRLADRAASLTLLSPAGTGEEINRAFISKMLGAKLDDALPLLGESIPPESRTALENHLKAHGIQLRAIAASLADEGHQAVSILASLAALNIPVTAVYQRDDAIIPASHALNLPPNVSARFIPGMSHMPHWRDPDLVAGLVCAAL